MKTHKFNYPATLAPCQFCTPEVEHEIPLLQAAIIRLPDGRLSTAFHLQCSNCGYTTKTYEYPDIVCHAWNMAPKLSVNDLCDEIVTADKKDE